MTEPLPLISVIIPCYNQARFLGDAIESVIAQTYQPTEIVVVDDGSTESLAEVASRYPKIRFLRQKNQGPAAARNAGLRESKGTYIAFLDADDRLLPNGLEIGMQYLMAHPDCAFVSGHCRYISVYGSPLPTPNQPVIDRDHYLALLHRNYVWAGCTVLHRRSCLEAVDGYNPSPKVKGAEDYELYLRLTREFPVFCHGCMTAEYRQYVTDGINVSGNPGLMLGSTLFAMRGQWSYVKGNRANMQIYKQGLRYKKRLWGGLLLDQIKAQLTNHERMRAVRGLLMLIRYDPQGFLKRLAGFS
jgi:glycosyltransferase involved in cell wall biosynthesis